MASVVYDGPHSGVVLPDGREFVKGQPVKVDDELFKVLTRQGFKAVTNEKAGK